jgi:Trypsin-like peptidase domain
MANGIPPRFAGVPSSPTDGIAARHLMQFRAVRIEILDQHGQSVMVTARNGERRGPAVASGFLLRDDAELYLYTCWHVVTGIELANPVLPGTNQRRSRLKVSMQRSEKFKGTIGSVGGSDSFEVELYEQSDEKSGEEVFLPRWEQDEQAVSNSSLAMANLVQPFWHDIVRIRLPAGIVTSTTPLLSRLDLWADPIAPADPLLLVGYPHGFSARQLASTPIVVKRHVAAISRDGARREILIDGAGAPGMSGGPVFYEWDHRLYLFGVYVGVIFPDAAPENEPERSGALGIVCPMNLLAHQLRLARAGTPANS